MSDESDEAKVSMYLPGVNLTPQEEKVLNDFERATGIETADAAISLLVYYGNHVRLQWAGETGANGKVIKLWVPASPQPEVVFEWLSNELLNFSRDEYISRFNEDVGKFVLTKQR